MAPERGETSPRWGRAAPSPALGVQQGARGLSQGGGDPPGPNWGITQTLVPTEGSHRPSRHTCAGRGALTSGAVDVVGAVRAGGRLSPQHHADADLLLDAGAAQTLGLGRLPAPAVQLPVRGQGQRADAGLGLQGRQQEGVGGGGGGLLHGCGAAQPARPPCAGERRRLPRPQGGSRHAPPPPRLAGREGTTPSTRRHRHQHHDRHGHPGATSQGRGCGGGGWPGGTGVVVPAVRGTPRQPTHCPPESQTTPAVSPRPIHGHSEEPQTPCCPYGKTWTPTWSPRAAVSLSPRPPHCPFNKPKTPKQPLRRAPDPHTDRLASPRPPHSRLDPHIVPLARTGSPHGPPDLNIVSLASPRPPHGLPGEPRTPRWPHH